ncbi:SGNH/GDSL hydrolase family protein [Aporhodopirellula aestuarii]|uniref:SGNH/GDSL hydrolase family protein n=1 Tax=Aporhodopirellula aestuarii TaxID=2950107 RepID=A0ABT0TZU0_9BACT|nr:SGNH/GDSL hydrolase family protein [Aporhodopirellula aestuarii]MCM2370126.1 SGNH/GDSL hydrolase family protein [Aporhodopirellula aestuarii]
MTHQPRQPAGVAGPDAPVYQWIQTKVSLNMQRLHPILILAIFLGCIGCNACCGDELASVDELYDGRGKAFANPKDNPALPNVLLIGDSISIGYTPYVRNRLKERADVFRIPTNAKHSTYGLENLDKWLNQKPAKWDVIHFNWGLWDLCYRNPTSKTQGHRDKVNGTLTTTLEQYQANMEKIVARLKQTGATLIWCETTPVPEHEAGRKLDDDLKYNQVAKTIMDANGVLVNDLHSHAIAKLPGIQIRDGDVHFTEEGYKHLAEKVVSEISSALAAHNTGKQRTQ